MSSEDEVDYMSDDFLNHCVGNNDCRPGLLMTQATKRKIELEKKKQVADENMRKRWRPIAEIQREKLKEGLETPIDTSNKGFALMQKMGYKSGMSLGKQGNGIVEPVGIVVKSDRIGIGWQELLKEKRKKIAESRRKKEEIDPLAYRALKSNLHHQKKIESDLRKSRKSCYNLDSREGILNPHEYWFWPEQTWENEGGDGEYDEDEYEEEEESTLERSEENGKGQNNEKQAEVDDEAKYEEESDETLEPSEQLQVLTSYLRSTYFYCIWCYAEYESLDDLEANCPGSSRQEHDD